MFAGLGGAGIDAHWQNFVRLLAEYKRLEVLPQIAEQYEILRAHFESEVGRAGYVCRADDGGAAVQAGRVAEDPVQV